MANSPVGDTNPVKLREEVVLQKFEGDPADGELLETIRMVDGEVVERTVHTQEDQ